MSEIERILKDSPDEMTRFADHIMEHCRVADALRDADEKKLLWLLIKTEWWGRCTSFGVEGALRDELERRLYPEYDGENVFTTETGWATPDGPVNYL